MARWWFFLVLLNSSSFSATLLSISCLTWPSSTELSGPYSPLAQGFPQPPPEQPAAPPSLVLDDVSVCPSHGWSGLPRRADQVDP